MKEMGHHVVGDGIARSAAYMGWPSNGALLRS